MAPNVDPRTKYPRPPYPHQTQDGQPGTTEPMWPQPDHGEHTYRGSVCRGSSAYRGILRRARYSGTQRWNSVRP